MPTASRFSGELSRALAHRLRVSMEHIVKECGFTVNAEKARLMGRGGKQTVTGVVVNQTLGLSR